MNDLIKPSTRSAEHLAPASATGTVLTLSVTHDAVRVTNCPPQPAFLSFPVIILGVVLVI